MIVWAFKQWRGAVMIREDVNKALKNTSPDTGMSHCDDQYMRSLTDLSQTVVDHCAWSFLANGGI